MTDLVWSRDDAVVHETARLSLMWPGFDSDPAS